MKKQQEYPFSKYLSEGNFDKASEEHGLLHTLFIRKLEALRRKIEWAKSNQPLREVEKLEAEYQELHREFTLMNDDYEYQRKQAALLALDHSSDTLNNLRAEVRSYDEQFLAALDNAWQILDKRMAREVERNRTQQRLSDFSKRYPEAGLSLHSGRGIQTSWGRGLPVAANELLAVAWRDYCARFAANRTTNLADFNSKKV